MKKGLLLVLLTGFVAGCQTSEPVQKPQEPASVPKPDPFVFRIHLEAKSADGVSDSLIQDLHGKNDVLVLDPVIQLDQADLEKVEFVKNKQGDFQISWFLTKDGLKKLNSLAKSKKGKSILFYVNGTVLEKMKLETGYKKPVLKMKTLLTEDQAMKIKQTVPAEFIK
ncbi:MAG: hypothetical protein L6Q77_08195 [Bacteroidetes bacterium]|nr:hypothetical protein [Bacteroidota bacterium]